MEVIVEVGAERRIPRDIPSPLLPVGCELCEGSARSQREGRVALAQQREVAQRVHVPRAARASLLPCRIEHEVIDDELAAALEQWLETELAARAVEYIVFLDPHHRQATPLGVDAVVVLGELLLVRK